ncbi:MAG: ribonuclease P protein component [Propionibacteriaceae bacterium]|nr:ribonuclease P protein component [Propionibacteriaceae bacterium]
MLPQHLRLRKSADFVSVIKRGRKVSRPTLILYARTSDQPRLGVVVGKGVGGAVQRNQVKRYLRHQGFGLMGKYQPMDIVVRALPGSLQGRLCEDLVSAWDQADKQVSS